MLTRRVFRLASVTSPGHSCRCFPVFAADLRYTRGLPLSLDRLAPGQLLAGPLFGEPMRVLTVQAAGGGALTVGLVGVRTSQYRSVTLRPDDLDRLSIQSVGLTYDADGALLRLGLQAYALGIAYEFDPYFALSVSRVDPLPHQLSAVYDHLLKLSRVRFLLADDAGAGKTIMAGLLIRELKMRGLADRVLIVCPANLTFQWQRELREKFGETLRVLRGSDLREQFGVNQWVDAPQVIASLDLVKRDDVIQGLRQARWDLAIVDEAHRMSWTPPAAKTERYRLGELLREQADHLLLLTATPHKGDPDHFRRFLQLLDEDAYADVKSVGKAMDRRLAPFYLRRTKAAMVYFPERQPDGTWAARRIFTKRIPHTVDFQLDGPEFELYRDVTQWVKRQSARASAQGDDPRARAVGFLMALYQRRLASSTRALRQSLENRARRLDEGLRQAQRLAATAPPDLPSQDELEEMEDWEREQLERTIEAITLTASADLVRQEIAELKEMAGQAATVESAGSEAKLVRLRALLDAEGFFQRPDQRLLIFTEFKDTLDYLVERFRAWGFRVGHIHGGMRAGSREEAGSRLFVEQQFKDGDIQVLVATEAAGEGINLQCCHILFNYDIPWNPNRLEQRMGRIHRYGQVHDCLIFNFVATNTIEGRVLQKLLDKLQQIRDALDDDAVFNVVGEVLPAAHVERVLRDYYAGRLGDADLEDRMLRDVDEGQFRAICQNALEGLATKSLNLEMLVERRARAQERRVVPETIYRFMAEAAPRAGLTVTQAPGTLHAFDVGRTPPALMRQAETAAWRLGPVASRYPRCSTDRPTAEAANLEWVTPGHPLFEALRRHAVESAQTAFARGACLFSLQHDGPARIDFYRARVVDGLGRVAREKLFAVEVVAGHPPQLRDPAALNDMAPGSAPLPTQVAAAGAMPPVDEWLHEHALAPLLDEVRLDRTAEVERVRSHVELSLGELLHRADLEIGKAAEEVRQKVQGAEGRLAQAEQKHDTLSHRRRRRLAELEREAALTLQGVERLTSVVVLPHPEREAPDVRRLRPNPETEAVAMRVAMEHERAAGRQVFDVHEQNLGYDLTSLDLATGELRLIEVKGLGAVHGTVLLTPNERRVAEDRRDCFWLYVITDCSASPILNAVQDPFRYAWHEVVKVQHYWLEVDAMQSPMAVREPTPPPYSPSQD